MSRSVEMGPWVVYRMDATSKLSGMNVVCPQTEWDAMQIQKPGYHTLIRAGIASETEAEKLARGTSGDPKPRNTIHPPR